MTSTSPLLIVSLGAAITITEAGLGPQDGAWLGLDLWCFVWGGGGGGKRVGEFILLVSVAILRMVLATHLMSSNQSINLVCSLCSLPCAIFSLV